MRVAVIGDDFPMLSFVESLSAGGHDIYFLQLPGFSTSLSGQEIGADTDLAVLGGPIASLQEVYRRFLLDRDDLTILCLHYGIQAENMLSVHLPMDRILSGVWCDPRGTSAQGADDLLLGKVVGSMDRSLLMWRECLAAGGRCCIEEDMAALRWGELCLKMVWPLMVLLATDLKSVTRDRSAVVLWFYLLLETFAVVRRAGIEIRMPEAWEWLLDLRDGGEEGFVERMRGQMNTNAGSALCHNAVVHNLEKYGVSDVDFLSGEIVFLAKQMYYPAPFNEWILQGMHELERGQARVISAGDLLGKVYEWRGNVTGCRDVQS